MEYVARDDQNLLAITATACVGRRLRFARLGLAALPAAPTGFAMDYLDFTDRQMLPPTLGIASFKTKPECSLRAPYSA
jgi:hypothetical protein